MDAFCEHHGPYDASAGSCPYCGPTGRPAPPSPLGDDLPTEDWNAKPVLGGPAFTGSEDETVLPGGPDRQVTHHRPPAPQYQRDSERATALPERSRSRFDDDADELHTVVDRPDDTVMGWFVIAHSPSIKRGHMWRIKSGNIYGRDPRKADTIVDDHKVSGLHARVQIKDENFVLIDLGSVNGTFVNGNEILGQTVLQENDEVRFGDTIIVLKVLMDKKEEETELEKGK